MGLTPGIATGAAARLLGPTRLRRVRGELLGRRHMLPDFVIIGAARSGTTWLLGQLGAHPNVLPGPPEPHFFDSSRYRYGLGWYRLRFPALSERGRLLAEGRSPVLTGESSPSYLADPRVPERLAAALPDARLIVLLRDPASRAASHWNWCLRQCGETRSLAEAVAAELGPEGSPEGGAEDGPTGGLMGAPGGLREPVDRRPGDPLIVRRGLYQEQLERWHAQVGRERLLVIPSERVFRQPLEVMTEVWRHLGVPPLSALPRVMRNRNKPGTPYDEAALQRLREFYRPWNARLAEYLGMPLDWE